MKRNPTKDDKDLLKLAFSSAQNFSAPLYAIDVTIENLSLLLRDCEWAQEIKDKITAAVGELESRRRRMEAEKDKKRQANAQRTADLFNESNALPDDSTPSPTPPPPSPSFGR